MRYGEWGVEVPDNTGTVRSGRVLYSYINTRLSRKDGVDLELREREWYYTDSGMLRHLKDEV